MRVPSLLAATAVWLSGCGYHTAGAASHLPPTTHTLAVPNFSTRVQNFHTETAFTEAVIREFDTRTKLRVENRQTPATDAILTGTILTQTSAPLTYDSLSGQTSSYLLTITASVVLTDTHTRRVLYQNDALTYREQYQSTTDLNTLIQEDSAAVQRLSRAFAAAVVSEILESL